MNPSLLTTCRSLSTAVLLLCTSATGALGATIAYTSTYYPSALPRTSGGTVGDPSWVYTNNSGGVPSISGDTLIANTVGKGNAVMSWQIGRFGSTVYGTEAAWSISSTVGVTIDFTLRVTGADNAAVGPGGFQLAFGDGSKNASFFFGLDSIKLYNASVPANSVTVAFNNTVERTFRIVMKNGAVSLFESGSESAILTSSSLSTHLPNWNVFYFGDGSGSGLVNGSYELSFLGWNNALAEYSAPPVSPIPEPSAYALLIFASASIFYFRRRPMAKKVG